MYSLWLEFMATEHGANYVIETQDIEMLKDAISDPKPAEPQSPDDRPSNNSKRSDLWEQIYSIVSKLKLDKPKGDAYDFPTITTELERLILSQSPDVEGWEGVEDRLPEPEWNEPMKWWQIRVIAGEVDSVVYDFRLSRKNKEEIVSDFKIAMIGAGLTHWMLLPNPPKK